MKIRELLKYYTPGVRVVGIEVYFFFLYYLNCLLNLLKKKNTNFTILFFVL